jgi:AraC family transcriptional regulator
MNMAANTSANGKSLSINPFNIAPAIMPSNFLLGLKQQSRPVQAVGLNPSQSRVAHFPEGAPQVTFSPDHAVKRRALHARQMTAEVVLGTDKIQIESHVSSSFHTLIAYQRGSRSNERAAVEGLPPSSTQDLTHKLVFVPAGTAYSDRHTHRASLSAVYFHFAPELLPHDADPDAAALPPRLYFENSALWNSMQKLKEMLENPAFEDQAYFEALGLLLAHEVLHAHSAAPTNQPPARGGLAPWQQRIVTGYIEEHLTETIPLATLAGLVHLSSYYFCRAFKQSLGVPPHRYHINRRIELAKRMLLEREQSVTHIGLALGFGETSSFSAAFRKVTGTTPTSYQRNIG